MSGSQLSSKFRRGRWAGRKQCRWSRLQWLDDLLCQGYEHVDLVRVSFEHGEPLALSRCLEELSSGRYRSSVICDVIDKQEEFEGCLGDALRQFVSCGGRIAFPLCGLTGESSEEFSDSEGGLAGESSEEFSESDDDAHDCDGDAPGIHEKRNCVDMLAKPTENRNIAKTLKENEFSGDNERLGLQLVKTLQRLFDLPWVCSTYYSATWRACPCSCSARYSLA